MSYSPGYFLPSFLQDKVGCEAPEAEETVGSVQAWAANMEKTKQRLQNEVEELTVDLRRQEIQLPRSVLSLTTKIEDLVPEALGVFLLTQVGFDPVPYFLRSLY